MARDWMAADGCMKAVLRSWRGTGQGAWPRPALYLLGYERAVRRFAQPTIRELAPRARKRSHVLKQAHALSVGSGRWQRRRSRSASGV